ncbi:MAG: archaeal proteasome endopeptidase complex subunit beta [Thaumarchaeota archaeon]|nr:archaeal proteasome endopeptidase complex subunit beta [Nitrososphaerota archaeon]
MFSSMNLDKQVKTGTTTVGLVVKDGVALATDTRATTGFFIAHRKVRKVYPLADYAAITIAGRVADAQSMIDYLKANIGYYSMTWKRPMSIASIARLAANMTFRWRIFPYEVQLIIAGVDSKGPHLFNVDLYGTLTEEKLLSTGSGSPIAYGVLESEYDEGMSVEDAAKLVFKAVAMAIQRDIGSGDSIDVAYIKVGGKYKELTLEEKKPLYAQYVKTVY